MSDGRARGDSLFFLSFIRASAGVPHRGSGYFGGMLICILLDRDKVVVRMNCKIYFIFEPEYQLLRDGCLSMQGTRKPCGDAGIESLRFKDINPEKHTSESRSMESQSYVGKGLFL